MSLPGKIVREVGLSGALRLAAGGARSALASIRPLGRADRSRLSEDARRLRGLPSGDLRRRMRGFIEPVPCSDPYARLREESTMEGVMFGAGLASTCSALSAAELGAWVVQAPSNSPWYRNYVNEIGGNGGKNDHWEWHLVPWHRAMSDYAIVALDHRADPAMVRARDFYLRSMREERPWMTWVSVGSNVSGVSAGRALFALIEYGRTRSEKLLARYIRYYGRFIRAARQAFDVVTDSYGCPVSVPMEGLLYGLFFWRAALVLGLVQRQLGISCVFDLPEIRHLPAYMYMVSVGDGFIPLGDSRHFDGENPDGLFTAVMRTDDEYVRSLDDRHPSYHYLRDRMRA